jgi:hypothetical protein
MSKTTIIILIVILVLSAGILYFVMSKNKKETKKFWDDQNKQDPAGAAVNVSQAKTDRVAAPGPKKDGTIFKPVMVPTVKDDKFPLVIGSKGKNVKLLQLALGIKTDGSYGPQTAATLKKKMFDTDGVNAVEFNSYVFDMKVKQLGMAPQYLKALGSGDTGYWVSVLQILLDVTPTGKIGDSTLDAMKKAGFVHGTIRIDEVIAMGKVKIVQADSLQLYNFVNPVF